MKKIGILSMQRIYNYGSFLQAYGLKKIMENLGCIVEFVDYKVEKPIIVGKKRNKINKLINILFGKGKITNKIAYIRHKKNFKKNFYKLNISDYKYNSLVDVLIIGSDEVFNCIQSNPNVGYSLELFGKDNRANVLASYAASFGNTSIQKLNEYEKCDEIACYLKKFKYLSVRDENSVFIIKELTGLTPEKHIDPVLLYDFSNDCNFIYEKRIQYKYILLYSYNSRMSHYECEFIKKSAKKNGLKVLCIGGVQAFSDKFIDCSPFELFSYFKNAEFIITDTFHGTIFSIINKKKFSTIIRKSEGNRYGNEEKLTSLLDQLGLMECAVYDIDDMNMNVEIDYNLVFDKINNKRNESISYLKKIIS